MSPLFGGAGFCGDVFHRTTCKLGGHIVVSTSENVVIAADVTVTAADSPDFFIFGTPLEISATDDGLTDVSLLTVRGRAFPLLQLRFSTPTAGSLDGYTGGPLSIKTTMVGGNVLELFATLVSGSLTEVTGILPVPEPSTWAMMLLGFAGRGFACYRASRSAAAS
jgi:hypothetical protein